MNTFKTLAGYTLTALLLAAAVFLCGNAAHARVAAYEAARQMPAAVCYFDGGGTLAAGNAARTSDGHVWECTAGGRLVELSASVRHHVPRAHVSLPSWVHWAPSSSLEARDVCGRGVQAITIWGGNGDTSAVVCGNGKADVS